MFELNQTGSDMSEMSNIDNDVSELLRESFGDQDQGGSELDLDKNLNDILEDLKKSVSEDLKNNNGKRGFQEVSADFNQFEDVQNIDSSDSSNDQSLLEIHKDLEFEIESDRIERLRNPRFQTMPAFKKRAKQEAQWREAVSAARRAQSLSRGQCQQQKPSDGSAGAPITIPLRALSQPGYPTLLPKPKPSEKESQLDLTSLDLPTTFANCGDDDCYIVETRMKVGPQTNQKKSKSQMGAAETVKTIKTNLMISTKKHLSMSNHFPANSRIFNRSLQELQRTADVISSHYLATSRNSKPTSDFLPPLEHEQSYQVANTIPDFNSVDAIQNGVSVPKDIRVYHPTNSEAVLTNAQASKVPQNKNKSRPSSASTREIARKGHTRSSPYPLPKPSRTGVGSRTPQPGAAAPRPPLPLLTNSFPLAEPPLVPLASHLPIREPPVYNSPPVPVSAGPVKLPISGTSFNNNPNKCLLLNLGPQNPVILNKKQILQTVTSRRPPGFGEATVQKSSSLPKTTVSLPKSSARPCHNCQRLSKYLPFLGYSWRKLLGMDKSQVLSSLVLMCEACGLFVRETVIYGDHMRLDHVAAAHFPTFLHNSPTVLNFGESQNFIQLQQGL